MNLWDILWGALGGAATALVVLAFLSKKLVNHFFSKDLDKFRAQLDEIRSERNARREYEYDARKRLYQEYEPLLFQLIEFCENAVHRVFSLARVARDGHLKTGKGWLSGDGYYMLSTIYNLMTPMAIFRMIQRRLTMFDLRLDYVIQNQYLLAKHLYYLFTEHHEFAINYEPHIE